MIMLLYTLYLMYYKHTNLFAFYASVDLPLRINRFAYFLPQTFELYCKWRLVSGASRYKSKCKTNKVSDRFDYIDRLFKELDSTVWQSMANSRYELRYGDGHWPRREWTHSHSGRCVGWDSKTL